MSSHNLTWLALTFVLVVVHVLACLQPLTLIYLGKTTDNSSQNCAAGWVRRMQGFTLALLKGSNSELSHAIFGRSLKASHQRRFGVRGLTPKFLWGKCDVLRARLRLLAHRCILATMPCDAEHGKRQRPGRKAKRKAAQASNRTRRASPASARSARKPAEKAKRISFLSQRENSRKERL